MGELSSGHGAAPGPDQPATEPAAAQTGTWSVRSYRPGDEESLVRLFHQVFHRSITAEHWRWKFRGYPRPVENVWLAVDGNDRPVFHYAGIPCRLRLPTGEEPVMVAVDAMTAREFRRRGVFTTVVRRAHDEWRKAGVRLVLGLPNERWGSRTQALGYVPLFPLKWLIRPLRPEALLGRRLHLPGLGRWSWIGRRWNRAWDRRSVPEGDLEIEEVERAGEEFDRLWRRLSRGRRISLVRDAAWVNWRYLESPQYSYRVLVARRRDEVLGYAAWRVDESDGRRFGFLAELVVPAGEEGVWHFLLQTTLRRLEGRGAEAVATLALPRTGSFRALRRRGFLWSWGAFTFHTVLLDPHFPTQALADPGSWTLHGSEFDVL